MRAGPAEPADFLSTSNFDLWYFCSLLTYKDAQYLIWKIWFISVWSLKPKAVVWLLTGFMLGQSTLISYHTEANGCIFFASGVWNLSIEKTRGATKWLQLYKRKCLYVSLAWPIVKQSVSLAICLSTGRRFMKVRTIATVANKQRVRTLHLKNDLFQIHLSCI